MNRAQRRIHDLIKKSWQENKIIRLIILKARQLGSSTYIEALIYAITSFVPNINSLIIADDLDGSNYIFEMSKLYQEKMDECLRTGVKRSNEKKLEFDGIHSQMLIDTAENPEAGRKYTFRLVHLSEYAFFNKNKADAIMLGLSHSVPALPRTIIIKETTANGFNFFKDDWDRAINGESDETPVFVPWYWGEDNRMPVEGEFVVGDPALGKISQDELILKKQMEDEGIDFIEERLYWRRWDIRNNCKGDIDAFRQENPSTPEEAFIASGECFFDKQELARQLKLSAPPLFRANIVKENYKYRLRKGSDGVFSFWKEPSQYGQYAIGGDACSGSGADYAVLVAREKASNEVVATFRGKVDPDELAFRAMQLGNVLNEARVAIENDKFGFSANNKLRTIYGNIYVQRTFNKTENKMVEKFGWDTNAVTRPLMLAQMQEEVREGTLQLNNPVLIREGLTFIKNPDTKKAEAQDGCNDDTVIACAISGMIRQEEPHRPKTTNRHISEPTAPTNAGLKFKKRT